MTDIADSPGTATSQEHAFQAEVSRLLHLVVHAVYSEREIFLRELVSNASDACDKLRYEAIAKPELLGDDTRLAITIQADKDRGTLSIRDNGIGMGAEELTQNLGTIARSGTRAFLESLGQSAEGGGLIGQFGVGFYSAFMVADRVEVLSHRAGTDDANVWVSDGTSGFTLRHATGEEAARIGRGTIITLQLKDDAKEYLEPFRIEQIVKTYSDHILFPVEFKDAVDKTRQLNSASALWQRTRSEVKPEDYKEVYQTVSGLYDEPAMTIHYKAEGRQAYAVLLFVPSTRPYDILDPDRRGRVKLYVRRVFITDDAGLLPPYLRFVRGVVDSEDVPLNISREMLQNNPMVAQIRKALTTRVLNELQATAEKEPEQFARIWESFGQTLKEGLYEDFERREQLLKLARFRSTHGEDWRSLADYVVAMRENQTEIYYLAAETLDRAKASPQLEAARARGIEVLLLADPIDSFWTMSRPSFDGKPLRSLSQGDVDLTQFPLTTETASSQAADASETSDLVAALKTALGDAVTDVRVSKRLVDSAVCLVAPGEGPDRQLEKFLERQSRGTGAKPILEINPAHAMIVAAAKRFGKDDKEEFTELAEVLLGQAYLLEGEIPADPAGFTRKLNRLIVAGIATGV